MGEDKKFDSDKVKYIGRGSHGDLSRAGLMDPIYEVDGIYTTKCSGDDSPIGFIIALPSKANNNNTLAVQLYKNDEE